MKIRISLLFLFFTCILQVKANDRLTRGLYFQSFEVDKDKRTCLDLTSDKALNLSKGFIMEFDLNLRRESQSFGYIFRLISNDTLNIDLLSDISAPETNFSLIAAHQTLIKYQNVEIKYSTGMWIKVKLRCDPSKNEITLSLNGVEKNVQHLLGNPKNLRIYFGGNSHNVFSTTDIAPMTIKDIRISDMSSRLVRYWKLGFHAHNIVYDECEQAKAVVSNPRWEIDNHTNWNKQKSFVLPGSHYCMTFDPVNNRIFIVKGNKIFIYLTKSQLVDTLVAERGVPFNTEFNQLEYNPVKNELISYNFASNHLALFNFNTLEWDNKIKTVIPPLYGHHSNCYLADDSLLITFGGYGYHRYNSILFKYNSAAEIWENFNLSATITPRYLGCMGNAEDGEILYFGGFGNESGRQEEFPKNYYDLFSIDVDKIAARKIWELPSPKEHFTNSNSLIIDKNNRKFYALAYSNKRYASVIKLHEYNLDKPEYRVVGDSIPYFFNDIESYCDLYQNSDSSELYAVTSSVKNNETEINIYSIHFPTLSEDEIIQNPPSQLNIWRWLWLTVPMGLIIGFIIFWKRQNRRIANGDKDIQISDSEEELVVFNNIFAEKKRSSISLLGNFQIIDSDGNDITQKFTPTTTQLFLLLLISTIVNGQGITSQELKKALWYDRDDENARNIRNVYLNKLRSILKSFGEIKVISQDGYWLIQSEKTVFCDYERTLMLTKILKNSNQFNKKLLIELVDIALKGTLLPNIQQSEWFDSYISNYANDLIECLVGCSKRNDVKTDLLLLLKIADSIMLQDNIDEEAIKLKCYALFHLGRKNQALQAFNKFTADYKYLLTVKHNLIFEEIIKQI